ncbi:MAG TPA: carbohydrate kinase family protein [Gaiellaceae bacterium]|nr:carbohydrate kinase family protein [Gaiellaceae bacterium]
MRRLGVVGLVSLDRVDGGLPRLGGAPVYAARALRLLGHPAVVATKLADEDRPRLAALGVPVVARSAGRTIGFRIENDGDRRSLEIDELGEPWTEEEARGWLGAALAGCDWVHAGALTRADFPAATLAALARGRKVSLDGQALVRRPEVGPLRLDADYDPEVLRRVDLLKLARDELDALGCELDEGSLASLGVREVVVTLGREGAVVFADGLAEHVPTFPLEGVDPTGAGDAWTTAYIEYRRRRHSPVSAARLANGAVSALLGRWPVR